MSGVKAQIDRVRQRIDRLLVLFNPYNDEPLTYGLLAAAIGDSEDAVRKWYQRGSIPPKGARRIVSAAHQRGLVGVTFDWVLMGAGEPSKPTPPAPAGEEPSRPLVVRETRGAGRVRSRSKTPAGAELSADDIATEAGKVLAPLLAQLAHKSPSVAGMWLLGVAAEANRQGVEEVHDLVDLARRLLHQSREHGAPDQAGGPPLHSPE